MDYISVAGRLDLSSAQASGLPAAARPILTAKSALNPKTLAMAGPVTRLAQGFRLIELEATAHGAYLASLGRLD